MVALPRTGGRMTYKNIFGLTGSDVLITGTKLTFFLLPEELAFDLSRHYSYKVTPK